MSPKATSKATLHRRYVLRIHDFLVHGSPPLTFCIVTERIISSRPITRASCKQVAGNDSSGRRTSIRNPTPSHVSFPPTVARQNLHGKRWNDSRDEDDDDDDTFRWTTLVSRNDTGTFRYPELCRTRATTSSRILVFPVEHLLDFENVDCLVNDEFYDLPIFIALTLTNIGYIFTIFTEKFVNMCNRTCTYIYTFGIWNNGRQKSRYIYARYFFSFFPFSFVSFNL